MKKNKNSSKLRFSIFSIFMLLFFANLSKAQISIDNITVSEGKGAMTSGFDIVISLSKPNGIIFSAQANNERANMRFGKKWGNFSALVTIGAFRNVPWAGPMFFYDHKWFDLFSWSGIGMSKDYKVTEPGWNPNFFFNYEEAGLNLGKNRFAYAIQWFITKKPDHFVIYRRNIPLSDKHGFFIETTYYITKDMPMFVLGYKHSFAKK